MPVITRSQSKLATTQSSKMNTLPIDHIKNTHLTTTPTKIQDYTQDKYILKQILLQKLSLANTMGQNQKQYTMCDRYRLIAELYFTIQEWFHIFINYSQIEPYWQIFLNKIHLKAKQFLKQIKQRKDNNTEENYSKKILIHELNSTINIINQSLKKTPV